MSLTLAKLNKLLKLSADAKSFRAGKAIHAHLIVSNHCIAKNSVEANSFINFYSKCGCLSDARHLFDGLQERRNVVSWAALMAGYMQCGKPSDLIGLFRDMVSECEVMPNEYVFATVVSSCSVSRTLEVGMQCHVQVLKLGLVFHDYVRDALLDMYMKCSHVGEAIRLLWDSMPGNSSYSYQLVLNGVVEHGYVEQGLGIVRRMVDDDVEWDGSSWVSVIALCACLRDSRLASQVHGKLIRSNNLECDMYVNSALINMYGKCGNPLGARNVFDKLQDRNVVLWTSVMAAYSQNELFEEALKLFTAMEISDVRPNEFTLAVSMNASAGLSTLRNGYLLHGRAMKAGFIDHVSVGSALIDMYAKSGNIEAANRVFSGMEHRSTISWNAIICGFSHHGLGKEALLVFEDMLAAEAVRPNHVTFVGVLSACAHLGLVDKGFYYFNYLMRAMGVEPGLEHHTCMVGLLGKAGKLEDAKNFMMSRMEIWDVVAWRTLLNACHIHKNYELAERVANSILEMDPRDMGSYTLLSNVYARRSRWDAVADIRKLMKDRKVRKEPGSSWIEIQNATHVFVSDDKKHPESSKIYEKVKEIIALIKPLGYVPDVDLVLHDVEDEQKEDHLCYHSEKLAMAYGIMKLPSGAPIVVIKNLRMCDDCHSAARLISKLTRRSIIIRDAKRFHHFQDGCCSCGDYW
ncbi:Pentatricopeptide repeat-containing protein At5g39680 [Linum grandiflorum]